MDEGNRGRSRDNRNNQTEDDALDQDAEAAKLQRFFFFFLQYYPELVAKFIRERKHLKSLNRTSTGE